MGLDKKIFDTSPYLRPLCTPLKKLNLINSNLGTLALICFKTIGPSLEGIDENVSNPMAQLNQK